MDNTIVVYHSPKKETPNITMEMANDEQFEFFLSYDNPNFKEGRELYWFSSMLDVAKSHAEWWLGEDGTKWRLTLKCRIPESSETREVHNYCNVEAANILIIEKIWWR
jgi:hypothetical protein